MSLSPSSVPRRALHIHFRAVLDETMVLDQKNREILVIDEIGGRILALADGDRDLDRIQKVLESEFSNHESLHADLVAFVEELLELGVLELAGC